ncbi:dihydrodipicolinate synthase family protein [Rhabdobacter roseus]|uniref:Dihydrodipicolinate synthase/N-acetylneuraminate lyase n=1 Tax=Rhabdobacter roseus TaxID=1655419 RepID=A0A840TSP0_9BACT|nr:dihydrodipicolinate synthase family protein [Rhabdobacter roseus]MBB5283020.1 dihydrodipicolinate synthase/N-acetylneuraminate lyase [Rhabdobacter roseus]
MNLDTHRISGSWTTLLLPIQADDTIDYVALAEGIDRLIALKVSGIYSNGTACEFYTQTEAEFDQINALLAEKCTAAGMPFQIGCSHMSPQLSLERLKRAVALKPSAFQVILPDWSIPTLPEIIHFLERIQQAAGGTDLVLYNPPHAKKVLQPDEYRQLREAGIELAGCKVMGGDGTWYAAMREAMPGMALFVPGHTLASSLLLGADGAYSNVACIHPGAAQVWYETMLRDSPAALEQEKRIQLFMQQYIRPFIRDHGYSNQAVDKFMAAVGGWAPIGTRLRWPYRSIPEAEVARVRAAGQELIPEFMREVL